MPARYNRSVLDAEAQAERLTRRGGAGVVLRLGLFYGAGDAASEPIVETVRRGWSPLLGSPDGYLSWLAPSDAALSERTKSLDKIYCR